METRVGASLIEDESTSTYFLSGMACGKLWRDMSSINIRIKVGYLPCWHQFTANSSSQPLRTEGALTPHETTGFGKHRHLSWAHSRSRMEEEARKLLEEGILKKLVSPGNEELSDFPNGTKVKLQCHRLDELSPVLWINIRNATKHVANAISSLLTPLDDTFDSVR